MAAQLSSLLTSYISMISILSLLDTSFSLRAGPTSKLILREMEEIRRQEAAPKFQ